MRRLPSLLLTLALAGVVAACGQGEGQTVSMPVLTAEPMASDPATPTAAPSTAAPTVAPTPDPDPTPTAAVTRDPDDRDRGAFVREYRPEGAADLDSLAADLDGDGIREVVVTYVQGGAVQLDVAWWDGIDYLVDTMVDGGGATEVTRTTIRDVNADGAIEVVVDAVGEGDASATTVWQVTGPRAVTGLAAVGGCAAGRATYGVAGAELADRDADGADEIYATCGDVALDGPHRYVWQDGAYRYLPSLAEDTLDTVTDATD